MLFNQCCQTRRREFCLSSSSNPFHTWFWQSLAVLTNSEVFRANIIPHHLRPSGFPMHKINVLFRTNLFMSCCTLFKPYTQCRKRQIFVRVSNRRQCSHLLSASVHVTRRGGRISVTEGKLRLKQVLIWYLCIQESYIRTIYEWIEITWLIRWPLMILYTS